MEASDDIRVIELFAGVGGFRLGLEGCHNSLWDIDGAGGFRTVWANQWEPGSDRKQFAFRCYSRNFDPEGTRPETMSNEDIKVAIDRYETEDYDIPACDMIVGGFPCQDYSVAKTLSQAGGLEGKKGVLWWQILRLVDLKTPRYLLLENVDRLLKSPASQRGRDFAIMLSCLSTRGYAVEWRVINAAEYGLPQRRRRVYIYAEKTAEKWDRERRLMTDGVIAEAFPVEPGLDCVDAFPISDDLEKVSDSFGVGDKVSRFQNAGVMQDGDVFTAKVTPVPCTGGKTLGNVLVSEDEVPESFYIPEDKLPQWKYLKDGKTIDRVSKSGFTYRYSEGSMAYPDLLTNPARTILTGEGGSTPSRFKHIILAPNGRYRRLIPDELDRIQCFPAKWTDTGMTDVQRAFCMGNALVTEIPKRIGTVIARRRG